MSVRAKWLWALFGLVAMALSVFMVRTFSAAGQFTRLPTYGTQVCTTLKNISGAEDIVIDRQQGLAFISSADRRFASNVRGEIFLLNLNAEVSEMTFVPLTKGVPENFRPVGLSFYDNAAGDKRLFVINRGQGVSPSVEIFKLENDQLNHLKTISSESFATANNLVAVGPEQFYLTNDGIEDTGAIQTFLNFANQKQKGNVVFFNGKKALEAAVGFVMPNGIAKSADGKVIYVSDTYARTLKFFSRTKDNRLTEVGDLFVGTGVDNIDIDDRGHIWIGAHPKLLDLFYHMRSQKNLSPSQVLEAVPGAKEGGKMRTVFLDAGERISGSSIGARYKDKVLIGALFERKILLCDIPKWEEKKKQ